jgi:hypothetical protein
MQVADKLFIAKEIYREILNDERFLRTGRDEMLTRAWKLGQILIQLKEEIGHGKWSLWLGGNWPELGERNAQRCMAFFKANETWKLTKSEEFRGFEVESVRKFMWGYLPAKERLQLDGDEPIKPGQHHLTLRNQFFKYDRQLRSGHLENFSPEIFWPELDPMFRRLLEYPGGREYFQSLVA